MNIGDKVYLKAVGNMARGRKEPLIKESEITRIGRKYFEVQLGTKPIKFNIESYRQENGGYSADWKLYFSIQEILDEQEFEKLEKGIKSKFDTFGKLDLTLDQLRRINEIISE
ncbi:MULTISPECIES: PolC-type DNA polymerase III N-terminal domain-containing protein [unclassified Paenibacillus]|uniref:beta barrel domain-containing protein n=1 Tax=unclassified Paenibacillus TaxID=185978 RepID=UPI001FACA2E0|nr:MULTISPECIES: PolC-type DNA polymerase III N-terminal domain-containing protein [unclassified Paenibacillus]